MATQREEAGIKINLDIAQTEKNIKTLQQQLKQLQEAKKQALDKNAKNALNEQIKETKQNVDELKKSLRDKVDIIIDGKAAGVTLGNLERAQRQLYNQLKNELVPGTKAFTEALNKYKDVSEKVAEGNKKLGKGAKGGFMDMLTGGLGALGIAVSIDKVVQFGKQSVDAFEDAEKTARQLESAVKDIANGDSGAVDILLKQSEALQKTTIFSDDDVQKAQTNLLQFGLSVNQVAQLLPKIADLASAKNISLGEATDIAVKGINGQQRGLKQLGLDFEDTGNKSENFTILLDKLNKFQGQSAVATNTASGALAQQKNEINNLQETIGEQLTPAILFLTKTFNYALEGAVLLFRGLKRGAQEVIAFFNDDYKVQLQRQDEQDARLKRIQRFADAELKNAQNFSVEKLRLRQKEIVEDAQALALQIKNHQEFTAAEKKSKQEQLQGLIQANETIKKLIIEETTNRKKLNSKSEGDGQGTGNPNAAAKKAADEKFKIAEELAARLLKLENDIAQATASLTQDTTQREIQLLQAKYDEEANALVAADHKDQANKKLSAAQKIQSHLVYQRAILALDKKFADDVADIENKANDKKQKDAHDAAAKANQDLIDATAEIEKQADAWTKANTKSAEESAKVWKEAFSKIGSALSFLSSAYTSFSNIRANKDQAVYNHEVSLTNKRKALLKKELDNKKISQEKYDAEVAKIDDQLETKRKSHEIKAWKQHQKSAKTSAIINGALAITNALATAPTIIAGIIMAALVAATTAFQIAEIDSQPPPEFAEGGTLSPDQLNVIPGPSHKQGGIDLVNKQSGKVIANMEGGEGVYVTSRKTTPGVKAILDRAVPQVNTTQAVNAARYGNGGYFVNQKGLVNFDGDTQDQKGLVNFESTGTANRTQKGLVNIDGDPSDQKGLVNFQNMLEQNRQIIKLLEQANVHLERGVNPDPFSAYRNFEKVQSKVLAVRNGSTPAN